MVDLEPDAAVRTRGREQRQRIAWDDVVPA